MWRIHLGIHAFGCNTIMAGGAVINDVCVIEGRAFKGCGGMTDAAILVGFYMAVRFALSKRTVMARDAVIHDACMIEGRWFKSCSQVAQAAILVGRQVVGWRGFASGCVALFHRHESVFG